MNAPIIVDSSALMAILLSEPDAETYTSAMAAAPALAMSAITMFEAQTVILRRLGQSMVERFNRMMALYPVAVHSFDDAQAMTAFEAYRQFGKGCGHPAQLNLCDCASYALARTLNAPLLFKGQDFIHTDIIAALPLLVPEAELSQ
ncbi:hypothetical protein CHU95_17765 [Niveispirillum lacus]|uniref:Ribonuclease VapC n=1 Tax=Niveispirillum lacus TaxID=1981099 RepID=A0A255YTS7_9PROT|nr:type II toxin-antitoxin system VapC family toxin [Niveispirillum lacus]OYQ32623.1 hypothetical protein CHU95_17765 [Niveispirillum lacus]